MSEDRDEGVKRVTFRADDERVERLDHLIRKAKVEGVLDSATSRSDLLRDSIDDLIDDLEVRIEEGEDQGNLTTSRSAAD
jgi:predicted transcriptional regulator